MTCAVFLSADPDRDKEKDCSHQVKELYQYEKVQQPLQACLTDMLQEHFLHIWSRWFCPLPKQQQHHVVNIHSLFYTILACPIRSQFFGIRILIQENLSFSQVTIGEKSESMNIQRCIGYFAFLKTAEDIKVIIYFIINLPWF